MLGKLSNLISRFCFQKKFDIQSFSYYIPAPPLRSTGYREKEFDRAFHHFINLGYDIIDIRCQSHHNANGSGMWFICVVRAKNEAANALNLENEIESFTSDNIVLEDGLEVVHEESSS